MLTSLPQGTKRKMSSEQDAYNAGPEEIDPQLVGPGVSSGMNVDDGPAPKRRGSAVDTQRIAQLSLYDRRNSVDGRGGRGGVVGGKTRLDGLDAGKHAADGRLHERGAGVSRGVATWTTCWRHGYFRVACQPSSRSGCRPIHAERAQC